MTKAELMTVRRQRIEIRQQEEYLIGLRCLREVSERSYGVVQSQSLSRRVESITIKILEAEEKLQWLYDRLEEMQIELMDKLTAQVEDLTLRRLLICRYVECLTWTETAHRLKRSRREVYRQHVKFASQLDAHWQS